MAWYLWLTPPLAAGLLTSLWAWWPNRPRRRPDTRSAVRQHERYLAELRTARPDPELARSLNTPGI